MEASAETPFEPLPEWRPEASPESAPVTIDHVIHETPASVEAPAAPAAEAPAEPAPAEALPPVAQASRKPRLNPGQEPAPVAPEPRQPDLPVITEADPNQPKRSGWWARAKANLTGH